MCAKKHSDILVHLDEAAAKPLYQQIYEQVRDAITSGRLVQGDRLISIRKLSADLEISHTTIEQAYLQLATEGLVRNVPRSGYIVERIDAEYFRIERPSSESVVSEVARARDRDAFFAENRSGSEVRYDFSYANLQPDSFPVRTWRQIIDEVLYSRTSPELARYAYTDDVCSLQVELARLLSRTRGVDCVPEQIVIQSGTGDALTMIMQLFNRETDVIGMENPGYATVHEVAQRQGFSMIPIPSDQGVEVFLGALEKRQPRIVFTTPSHQFPTGTLLPLDARTRLLKWAEENDAYIIEDDSCNEFRYATRPIPSLQSLDAFGRVIYLCNVSKVLSPSLRISYAVLPPKLLERYWELFNYAHPSVSWLEQEVLARFIGQGYWDAHVRKTAKGNHRRHDELLRCLTEKMGDMLEISGIETGMHLYVTVHNGMDDRQLVDSALSQGAKVYGTTRMRFPESTFSSSVMIGFSAIAFEDIEPGVAALTRAWAGDKRKLLAQ